MNSTINKEQAYQTGCWHFVQPCILVQKTTYHPFKGHTHTHKKENPIKNTHKKNPFQTHKQASVIEHSNIHN